PFAAALDARQLQRFKNEAQAAAHLHHEHIVPVYAVGCERGVHFYAMQFIEGHSLATLIQDLPRLDGREAEGAEDYRGPTSGRVRELVPGRGAPPTPLSAEGAPPGPLPRAAAADTGQPAARSTAPASRTSAFFRTVAGLAVQAAEALEHSHGVGV